MLAMLAVLLAFPALGADRGAGALDQTALDQTALDRTALDRIIDIAMERLEGQVERDDLYRAAMAGVATRLDAVLGVQGNAVLTEEEHRQLEAWQRGERQGIGVEYTIVGSQGLVLTDVFPKGPGEAAGLLPGDFVVAMNDHPFTGLDGQAIVEVLRRADGATVVLDVRRKGGKLRRLTVERSAYHLGDVRLIPGVQPPCVRVSFFGEGTARRLREVLAAQDPQGAVILDLRDNPGGRLNEMLGAAGLFLDEGAVVLQRIEEGAEPEPVVAPGGRLWRGKVVVLTNRGTEGSAEALVAALQDHRAAVVVGTPTAGHAALPSFHPVGGGLVLRLADATMRAPSGRVWAGEGLQPDLLVEPIELTIPPPTGEVPIDLQRDAAVQMFRSQ